MPSQTQSGKAWEYGLARSLSVINEIPISRNAAFYTACAGYEAHPLDEQKAIGRAADAAILFLEEHDHRVGDLASLSLQNDSAGRQGDPRDIVMRDSGGREIGISSKHRHRAVKHSRLSDRIDFGAEWYGKPCSNQYWSVVRPIFTTLRQSGGARWSELPNKWEDVYTPILNAFIQEVKTYADVPEMLRYLLGRCDYYKVFKTNGEFEVQSFNFSGGLGWGSKLALADRSIEFRRDTSKAATATLTMDGGWQLKFRLHSASSWIEPSLKFDVTLVGSPDAMANYHAPY